MYMRYNAPSPPKIKDTQSGILYFFRSRDLNLIPRRFAKQKARAWSPTARGARSREGDKGENKEYRTRATAYSSETTIFSSGHFKSLLRKSQSHKNPYKSHAALKIPFSACINFAYSTLKFITSMAILAPSRNAYTNISRSLISLNSL